MSPRITGVKFHNIVYSVLYLILSSISFYNCTNQSSFDLETEKLNNLFKNLGIKFHKNNEVVLVQSYMGCETCNNLVTEFIKNDKNSNSITYIIPFSTNKNMSIVYGDSTLHRENVHIDKDNIAVITNLVLDHSAIFYLDDNKIVKQTILTPQNIDHELALFRKVYVK